VDTIQVPETLALSKPTKTLDSTLSKQKNNNPATLVSSGNGTDHQITKSKLSNSNLSVSLRIEYYSSLISVLLAFWRILQTTMPLLEEKQDRIV
jgi:hypothetical protein